MEIINKNINHQQKIFKTEINDGLVVSAAVPAKQQLLKQQF